MIYFFTSHERGFSLLELMLVVALISLLVGVAYPSYQASVAKGRRVEAHSSLLKMQMEQEYYRMVHGSYASATGGKSNDVKARALRYFTLKIDKASATTYQLSATAKGEQVADIGCLTMTLDQSSQKQPSRCWK